MGSSDTWTPAEFVRRQHTKAPRDESRQRNQVEVFHVRRSCLTSVDHVTRVYNDLISGMNRVSVVLLQVTGALSEAYLVALYS
jgi:hypothetical protein